MWRRLVNCLRAETQGVVATEYIILVGTVGLGSAVAFIAVGVAFVRNFALVRYHVLAPFP